MTTNLVYESEELVVSTTRDAERSSTVVAGTAEPDYRFPWVVAVGGTLTGKGVLISPAWVLTAAHNVETVGTATVSYTRTDPAGRKTEGRQTSSRIVRHPSYVRGSADHDIALIQLPRPFSPDPYVQPAALPVAPVTSGQMGLIASFKHGAPLPAGHLAVLRGPITLLGGSYFEGRSATASLCPGDSGSGFIISMGGVPVVAGIAVQSTVQDCTQVNLPFQCTDVVKHLDWILSTSRINVFDRSAEFRTPAATGAPTACVIPGLGNTNIAYRESSGLMHELWRDANGATGTTRLSAIAPGAPKAAGNPFAYVDTARNVEILLFRDGAGVVRSLYWSTGAVGHDNLSGGARAPRAAGDPVGYYDPRTDTHHVFYRGGDGHLHELWWRGVAPVQYGGSITGAIGAPRTAGIPAAFVGSHGLNMVVYRSVGGQILSVYWADGPSGLDDLSGVAGTPRAAGDPTAYYTPHDDTHQVVYRGIDNHVYELYWRGATPVAGWNLTFIAGAPPAADTPAAYYSAGTNTKHVVYRSADNRLHDISWRPGGGMPVWTDLTARNAAPLALDRPAAFTVEGRNTQHVVYRGADNHIYELRW